jgi:hypothetical protein
MALLILWIISLKALWTFSLISCSTLTLSRYHCWVALKGESHWVELTHWALRTTQMWNDTTLSQKILRHYVYGSFYLYVAKNQLLRPIWDLTRYISTIIKYKPCFFPFIEPYLYLLCKYQCVLKFQKSEIKFKYNLRAVFFISTIFSYVCDLWHYLDSNFQFLHIKSLKWM